MTTYGGNEFAAALARVGQKAEGRLIAVHHRTVELATESIVDGSPITGAPGQPVRTGVLRASFQTVYESPTRATISTNVAYAEPIEDGIGPHGPMQVRSSRGGFHSVKLTVANADRLVDQAVRDVVPEGG